MATDSVLTCDSLRPATASVMSVTTVPIDVNSGQSVPRITSLANTIAYVASLPASSVPALPPSLELLTSRSVRVLGGSTVGAGLVLSPATASSTSIQTAMSKQAIDRVSSALSGAGIAVQAELQPKDVTAQVRLIFSGPCFDGIDYSNPAEANDAAFILVQGVRQISLANLNSTIMYDANIRKSAVASQIAMNAAFSWENSQTSAQIRAAAAQLRLKFSPIASIGSFASIGNAGPIIGVAIDFNNSLPLNLLLMASLGGVQNLPPPFAAGSGTDSLSLAERRRRGRGRGLQVKATSAKPTSAKPTVKVTSAKPTVKATSAKPVVAQPNAPVVNQQIVLVKAATSCSGKTGTAHRTCMNFFQTKPKKMSPMLQASNTHRSLASGRFRSCVESKEAELISFGPIEANYLILEQQVVPTTYSASSAPRTLTPTLTLTLTPTVEATVGTAQPQQFPTASPSLAPSASSSEQPQQEQQPSSQSGGDSQSTMSSGAVVGIVVGVLVLLGAGLLFVCLAKKSSELPRLSQSFSHGDVYGRLQRLRRGEDLEFQPYLAGGQGAWAVEEQPQVRHSSRVSSRFSSRVSRSVPPQQPTRAVVSRRVSINARNGLPTSRK